MTQELKDAFYPSHKLREKPIVMNMNLMDKLVKVVLVSRAQVDKCLNGLIRVCRGVLLSALFNNLKIVFYQY
jgi:hypothetical protein